MQDRASNATDAGRTPGGLPPGRAIYGGGKMKNTTFKAALLGALALPMLALIGAPASAKTFVYCSEGSPENFYPGINTTGTSFDANGQIYSRIVDFERDSTKIVPDLAERWTVSDDGLVYTFFLRKGVKWHSNANFKPTRDMNADDVLFMIERQ